MSVVAGTAAPVLADGVQLLGEVPGSGYRTPPSLARRGDGQVVQLTRLLYLVLAAADGRRSHAEIADMVGASYGRLVTADDVATLVDTHLRPLGLLRRADGGEPEVAKANPLLALRFRYVVTDPVTTRRITAPFAVLFRPLVVAGFLAAFVAVCWWVFFDKGLASATHEAFYRPGLLLAVFAVTVVSAGFHEFGHASAARYGGATPGAMGLGLYLVWPAFYTDVTDSYRLGRAGRVRTDLGGLYFNAIVGVAIFGLWWATGWDALLLIIATQVLQMVRQLAPLVRFDGYHVLADVTGVPDLYHHIKPTLLGLLPSRWGRPEATALKPWARAVVSVWVLLVVPLLLLSTVTMVLAFPRVAATAWDSLGGQWTTLRADLQVGDYPDLGVRLLSIVAIALPVLGMAYVVLRLVRRLARGVWRRTVGRPAQRAVAVVAAAAVAAALVWTWWPDPHRYRPIQSYERGALQDLAPIAARTGSGLSAGRIGAARTAWPGGEPLPTADDPALSVVLVPHDPADGSGAMPADATPAGTAGGGPAVSGPQAWVFPFNRPPAPADGDNQALAVNTTDGSTVYDVAFALVWAEDGTADNVNSAYALASCTACRTVAVAFQVVLVVGQTDEVIPQNIAAAVNYNCISCVTQALASQLVLTLDGPLSEAAQERLTALWREIAAYGEHLDDVPLSEIQRQLAAYQDQIKAIVAQEGVAASQTTTGTTASPGATPTDGATDATGGPADEASSTATPGAGPTGDSTTGDGSGTGTGTSADGSSSPAGTPTSDGTSTTSGGTAPSGNASPTPTSGSTSPSPSPTATPSG